MTDDQWLSAMDKYSAKTSGLAADGSVVGGAMQLSGELRRAAKRKPSRFAALIHRMPKTLNPFYFDAILMGIAGEPISIDAVISACETAHGIAGKPCGQGISDCLERCQTKELPQKALKMVAEYTRPNFPDHIRNSAFVSLANLCFGDRELIKEIVIDLKLSATNLPRPVRGTFSYALVPMFGTPFQRWAINLFLSMWAKDSSLPADEIIEAFLHAAATSEFAAIKDVLLALLADEDQKMRSMAAKQVGVAALSNPEARQLIEKLRSGDEFIRQGLAEACARNIRNTEFSDFCEGELTRLFDDPETKVRAIAAMCFQDFGGEELASFKSLITSFIESRACESNGYLLLMALTRSTMRHDDVTLRACERVVQPATNAGPGSHQLELQKAGELALRTYHQTGDSAVRERSLDLIDRMVALQVHGLEDSLRDFENRR